LPLLPPLGLALAAAAPFLPDLAQFARRGVPDVLFTGDGALLELSTLHAAHGTQLVGPYSRFVWSHPGPAFFYLCAPLYRLFHFHGPALNLTVLLANLACVLALVFVARRLRGNLYALVVAAGLGAYETYGAPFGLSGEWNPATPVLPLALLYFLAARLATGALGALPWFVLVASAMIQTHVGMLPVVLSLSSLAALLGARRWLAARKLPSPAPAPATRSRRRTLALLLGTLGVLAAMWALPVYENATTRPGNLGMLWEFFTTARRTEHLWSQVYELVFRQAMVVPVSLWRVVHPSSQLASGALVIAPGSVGVAVLLALLVHAFRRGDDTLAALGALALGALAAALAAVRAIRGDIEFYLLFWMTILGLFWLAAVAAWAVPRLEAALGARRAGLGVGAVAALVLVASLVHELGRADVFRAPEPAVEKLAADVEAFVVARHERPTVAVASQEVWPEVMGVILSLAKHDVPISVETGRLFMVGRQHTPARPDEPRLLIGDHVLDEGSRGRPDRRLVAASGDLYAYWEDPGYVAAHRLPGPVRVVRAVGTTGNLRVLGDGVLPAEASRWDTPETVVLDDTRSFVEVEVPAGAAGTIGGVFLIVDGNDTYAVHCRLPEGVPEDADVLVGLTGGERATGMRTRIVWSDLIGACRALRVSPENGDGAYSIGEIGFLRR
jgi:hypothetical protein